MRIIGLILGAGLCLAGCQSSADRRLIGEAKDAITRELSDPASAQFRGVRVGAGKAAQELGFVCGEVNGKNKFGGYPGFVASA